MASASGEAAASEEAQKPPREVMEYDVLIVGAGPAGLSAAIKLKQLAQAKGMELSVCVVEKGQEVGAHVLSGNVFQPTYLDELIPNWCEKGAPLETEVKHDEFYLLTETAKIPLPLPPLFSNHGNYIISLGRLCQWLAGEAEALGVEIYPGFAAAEVLYDVNSDTAKPGSAWKAVAGVATGDMGIGKDGKPTDSYARGMELRAKQTLFAEGVRGSCSEEVIAEYNLRKGKEPQTYGIGIKEVWEVPAAQHKEGLVTHTFGWPAQPGVYQGTFMYHAANNMIHMGIVVGLDYANPYISPYQELQKFKTHPSVASVLKDGKCVQYGARAINEGGWQSIPSLTFPGGALIGCSAGYVNVPKVKGSHNAMKSGMLAAEGIFDAIEQATKPDAARFVGNPAYEQCSTAKHDPADVIGSALRHTRVRAIQQRTNDSPIIDELYEVRNVRPMWRFGKLPFLAYTGITTLGLHGREPVTLGHGHARDCDATEPAEMHKEPDYPKPDGKLTFALLDNLARSGVNHEENQPSHLKIKKGMEGVPLKVSLKEFAGPESRFCPAGVYEYPENVDGTRRLQINAQNCVHCKTCSIKTPDEFIKWTVPQGGGGPGYAGM